MTTAKRNGPPPPSDADAGVYQGQAVARRVVSPEGWIILVGKTAADNDLLSLKLAEPHDFWLHNAAGPGSHVVIRNPERSARPPRDTLRLAAALALKHSKAKAGGRGAVHWTTCDQVSKPRGFAPGKVALGRFETLMASPADAEEKP